MAKVRTLPPRGKAPQLDTPTDLGPDGVAAITEALNVLLADTFALYLKTKNFHWHMSGPHFRDYHLLLDEHADQIFAIPTQSPNECGKSVDRRSSRSDTSAGHSELRTTTPTSSNRQTCSRNSARTTRR